MAAVALTLPASGGNIVCNRINNDGYTTEYLSRAATYDVRVRVRHTETKAKGDTLSFNRHNVEITKKVFADGDTPEVNSKVYLVVEHELGDDPTELVDALSDFLIASTNAKVTALLGWQDCSD